jgi:hypothetical protein
LRRLYYRSAHNRRRRRAPTKEGSAGRCCIVIICTPCIADLPLCRPRFCLTHRNTAFFGKCRRTPSEARVIHLCRVSAFLASRAICQRAHAAMSTVTFSDGRARVAVQNGKCEKGSTSPEPFGPLSAVSSVHRAQVSRPRNRMTGRTRAGHRLGTGWTPAGHRPVATGERNRVNGATQSGGWRRQATLPADERGIYRGMQQ